MALAYKYFRFPFASAGTVAAIPDTVQGDGSVSYPEGFGPDYALDPATQPAALNIPRDKSNQLYLDITQGMKYIQEAKVPQWIAAADNGGVAFAYDFLAVVLYTDGFVYQSLAAANNATPGASANWARTRIRFGANTTFYVATTGNNSNAGTNAAPWLTLQFANDNLLKNYDLNCFQATISVGNGTYAGGLTASGLMVGQISALAITGNVGSPSSVVIQGAILAQYIPLSITGFQLTLAVGYQLSSSVGGGISFGNINFVGAGSLSAHIHADIGGTFASIGPCTLSGGAAAFILIDGPGCRVNLTHAFTITGTPNYSVAFVQVLQIGFLLASGSTYIGAATGVRYSVASNAVIYTGAGGATFFPGNSAGTTATGGQYL